MFCLKKNTTLKFNSKNKHYLNKTDLPKRFFKKPFIRKFVYKNTKYYEQDLNYLTNRLKRRKRLKIAKLYNLI